MSGGDVVSRAEAIAAGSKHYYTGKACTNGHFSKRYVANFTCLECSREAQSRGHRDLEKRRETYAKWCKNNPEKVAAGKRRYYLKHKGEIIAKTARWAEMNPEAVRISREKWRKTNQSTVSRVSGEWRKANSSKAKKAKKEYYTRNPEQALLEGHRRRAMIRGCGEHYTKEEIAELRKASGTKCPFCSYVGRLTIDHIVPLAAGGTNKLDNIQFMCGSCNSSKHIRSMDTFLCAKGLSTSAQDSSSRP